MALDELLEDLKPVLKEAAGELQGSDKDAFERRLRAWNTRLEEQGSPDAANGEEEEGSVSGGAEIVEVVQGMAEWLIDFGMYVTPNISAVNKERLTRVLGRAYMM